MAIALDNAADACEVIASNDPLPVGCKILAQKNMLLIQVTNPLPGPLQYKDGEIQSAKAESGHGLGLPTLRWIVQKYAGDVTISDRGNVFCLSIMLFV
jgi:sensor histidine kinase regulating citrate/malate metabolism